MPLVISSSWSIPDAELSESFVRASGPGGQNVNKVATAVELRFDVGRASLPEGVKARLRVLAGQRLTKDDVVVIDAREFRAQAKNREAARARLAALVRQAATPPKNRRRTRPSAASRERRLTDKARRSHVKRKRRATED